MARVQLALNVSNLDEAIAFYAKLFAAEPAKVKPGYANFAIADPPLKLVLVERPDAGGTLNHLGIEVPTADEVGAAEARLDAEGLTTTGVADTTCCFAAKTETWVRDPDGAPWEVYVKTGDVEALEPDPVCCSAMGCDTAEPASSAAATPISVHDTSSCC